MLRSLVGNLTSPSGERKAMALGRKPLVSPDTRGYGVRPLFRFAETTLFPPTRSPGNHAVPRLQAKLEVGDVDDPLEREADQIADQVMRMPDGAAASSGGADGTLRRKCDSCRNEESSRPGTMLNRKVSGSGALPSGVAPPLAHDALSSPGLGLDKPTRAFFEPRFGVDFSSVRIHQDTTAAQSCRQLNASAYAVGANLAFAGGRYSPHTQEGRWLLAHELTHVVQQSAVPQSLTAGSGRESEAQRQAVGTAPRGLLPGVSRVFGVGLQRKVEMRDVGRGEQSGFARLPELINRLNAISAGLNFSMSGALLAYETRDAAALNNFDRQMMAFIDQDPVIPVRLTNRHGLLGDHVSGFHDQVDVDAWTSGYVDIDDLLASSDLGLESVLVHFLSERTATSNYARRIGSGTFTQPEFRRVHSIGIDAEAALLRDYFGDPTIHIVNDSPSPTIRRVFRNSRRDLIRRRVTLGRGAEAGVDAMSLDVLTHTGEVLTAEEYRQRLDQGRVAAQVERERLGGATEYRAGAGRVPAP